MEAKNTLELVEDAVRQSNSLKEAIEHIEAEMAKGGYVIVAQSIIEQRIASLWRGKERARERALERIKANYGGGS